MGTIILQTRPGLTPNTPNIEGDNNYIEILVEGSLLAITIAYSENSFKDQFENALRKHGIKFD